MEYGITRLVFEAKHHFLPLAADEYARVKKAKADLLEALSIEEKFNLIVENYEEFENHLLHATVREVIYGVRTRDWSSRMGELHSANRRLINLLSTCKLYLDQVRHDLNEIYGDDSIQAAAVRSRTHKEYDESLGYRVMEEIRRYIQHRSLPLSEVHHESRRTSDAAAAPFAHTTHLRLRPAELIADRKVKRNVLEELQAREELPSITPLVREYMTGLCGVHATVRDLLAKDLSDWDQAVNGILNRYRSETGDSSVVGVAVTGRDEKGVYVDSVEIFEDLVTRRQWLEAQNRTAVRFSAHIVTSG
jgi:hypothetical protein